MFDDVCSTFLLKECFAFDQTFRPTMLKRLGGFSTLLNKQMGGETPCNRLYGEASRVPFSGGRYVKGRDFTN